MSWERFAILPRVSRRVCVYAVSESMKVTVHPLSTAGALPKGVLADEALIGRLQNSFRSMTDRGTELADRFYTRLFSEHPEVRALFPANMANQKRKLLETLTLIVENLRSPGVTRPRIDLLGVSHVSYGARPEHYAWVQQALVLAMAETAGQEWSSELHADWQSAINLVAAAMINAARAGT